MDLAKEIEILKELKMAVGCLEDLNMNNEQLLKDVDALIAQKQKEANSNK